MNTIKLIAALVLYTLIGIETSVATIESESQTCPVADVDRAIETCRLWVRHHRPTVSALIDMGALLERESNYAAAIAVYDEGLLLHGFHRRLRHARILARSDWQEMQSSARRNTPLKTTAKAETRAELDTIKCIRLTGDAAIAACTSALDSRPADSTLNLRLARALGQVGRKEDALATYDRLLSVDPTNVEAKQERSDLLNPPPTKLVADRLALSAYPNAESGSEQPTSRSSISSGGSALLGQLNLLLELHGRGLISEAEFRERKQRLLTQAFGPSGLAPGPAEPRVAPTANLGIDVGNFHALVIGNNAYRSLPALETSVPDAQAISKLLRTDYGFAVKTLVNAKRYDIIKELSRLRTSLSPRDNVLVYYAGHGYLDETTGRGYWLPIDAEQDNPANWISTADVTDTLKGLQALHALVVADSCYSGTLLRALSPTTIASADRQAVIRRLAAKRSRTVMTSGGLEPVLDSGGGRHSVFAEAFLSVLRENIGVMEGGELFEALRAKVVLAADQTPEYTNIRKAGHEGGDFIFVRRP